MRWAEVDRRLKQCGLAAGEFCRRARISPALFEAADRRRNVPAEHMPWAAVVLAAAEMDEAMRRAA